MRIKSAALLTLAFLAVAAADPVFVTSDPNGGWSNGGYYVHNNMWNRAKYSPCASTLYAWSFENWHAVARMNNNSGDGAVKTYPNVHKDYRNAPVDSFAALTSHFAETSPRSGIYDFSYDIWLNGVATPNCTEIMIWNENCGQTPAGAHLGDAMFDGRAYKVYRTSNGRYIAFVAATNFTSGTVNLLDMIQWAVSQGWLSNKSTVDQICFGVEIVSTDNADAVFGVSAFSIDSKPAKAASN